MDIITAHFWWKKKRGNTKWENPQIPKSNMRLCGRWIPKGHKTLSKLLGSKIMCSYLMIQKNFPPNFCINSKNSAFGQQKEALKIRQRGLASKRRTFSPSSVWGWGICATFSNREVCEEGKERPGCLWTAVLPQLTKCKNGWHSWSKRPLVLSMSARHGPCCLSPLSKCASYTDLNLISNRERNRGIDWVVSLQIHMLKSEVPGPQNVTLIGSGVFTEVIKIIWIQFAQ